MRGRGLDSCNSALEPVVDSCEHGHEPSGSKKHLPTWRLTTSASVFDFYGFLLRARSSSHLAKRLVRVAILSTHWTHDRFTLRRALAARDPKFVDVTFLSRFTMHRHARVHTCANRVAVKQWHWLTQKTDMQVKDLLHRIHVYYRRQSIRNTVLISDNCNGSGLFKLFKYVIIFTLK